MVRNRSYTEAPVIPSEIVSAVIAATDIVEVVESYLPLKSVGRNHRALCPFHAEKTPSFTVNPEKQIFYCFGCREGGDVIAFLMKQERFTFVEAVRYLAERAGIRIPEKRGGPREGEERLTLFEVNRQAADYFRGNLLNTREGERAREYLRSRGVTETVAERFHLGYTLPVWDGVVRHLTRKGITPGLLEQAGLILPREKGSGFYDRFRDRVMIPIWDVTGKVVGFGGRLLPGTVAGSPSAVSGADVERRPVNLEQPKYMNSPETVLYKKGTHLYGLNLAARSIREKGRAILVEGYFDLIALHRAGFTETVAVLGTALTLEQMSLLRRYTDTVLLVFDPDRAGIAATIRALELLVTAGLDVGVVPLPDGRDPDRCIAENGAEAFQSLLDHAEDFVDFLLTSPHAFSRRGIEAEARSAHAILPVIARLPRGIRRAKYVQKVAERLGVPESEVLADLTRSEQAVGEAAPWGPAPSPRPVRDPLEMFLVRFLLHHPDQVGQACASVPRERIQDPLLRQVYGMLAEAAPRGWAEIQKVFALQTDGGVRSLVSELLLGGEDEWGDPATILSDCCARFAERAESQRREEIRHRLVEAERAGDSKTVEQLLAQYVGRSRNPVSL